MVMIFNARQYVNKEVRMRTGIPKVKQKLLYDGPKKAFEFLRDVLPFICLCTATSEPAVGLLLLPDLAAILIGGWVLARFTHTAYNYFAHPTPNASLEIPIADTALRTLRTALGPALNHLPIAVQSFLHRPLPIVGMALTHTAALVGLGALHLTGFAILTWSRRKALLARFQNTDTHIEPTTGIVRTKASKMLSINLKLLSLGVAFTGIGLICATPFVTIPGIAIAGTFALATALDIGLWTARLVYKHFKYMPAEAASTQGQGAALLTATVPPVLHQAAQPAVADKIPQGLDVTRKIKVA